MSPENQSSNLHSQEEGIPVDGLQNFPHRSPLASKRGRTWNDAGGWLANLNAPGSNTHEATVINLIRRCDD